MHLAARLYHLDGFAPKDVSALITDKTDYAQEVLTAYLQCYNFKGMTIVQALRTM